MALAKVLPPQGDAALMQLAGVLISSAYMQRAGFWEQKQQHSTSC